MRREAGRGANGESKIACPLTGVFKTGTLHDITCDGEHATRIREMHAWQSEPEGTRIDKETQENGPQLPSEARKREDEEK
jgi:hypothetical protein